MAQLPAEDHPVRKGLLQRLDHALADINAFLLVLAIGLATLDVTCFAATRSIDVIKPLLRIIRAAPLFYCIVGGDHYRPGR